MPKTFTLADYQVDLTYFNRFCQGDIAITATATENVDRIALDPRGLTVRSVSVDGKLASRFWPSGDELVVVPHRIIHKGQRFHVRVGCEGPVTRSAAALHRILRRWPHLRQRAL
ncbi:hypothetical protein [Amycolatopsis anabasis]|uniref:hypothetical protein n=1 Tax=Amycolatopsis anabasis TaxID=1840409 RepID=UPI00131A9828|nr:hypothetical protein [Amycolatopsis anabasis]